jgi:hypothetical protein
LRLAAAVPLRREGEATIRVARLVVGRPCRLRRGGGQSRFVGCRPRSWGRTCSAGVIWGAMFAVILWDEYLRKRRLSRGR